MARKAFYSFHFEPDNWRASKVRNMGVIEGNRPASDNDWESITDGGEEAIKRWIASQMSGKSVMILLIGSKTAGRKWIKYEIKKAWTDKKGVLGIHIHNLLDRNNAQTTKGRNPFSDFKIGGKDMASIVQTYDSPYITSSYVYNYIKNNLSDWIEKAIEIRKSHG